MFPFHTEQQLYFATPIKSVAQSRWFFHLTKWRLAKLNKLLTE
jgi:hypothetical protein